MILYHSASCTHVAFFYAFVVSRSSSQVCPRSSGTSNLPHTRKRTRSKSKRLARNTASRADNDDSSLYREDDQSYLTNACYVGNENQSLRYTTRTGTGRDFIKWRSATDLNDCTFLRPGDCPHSDAKQVVRPRSYSTPSPSSASSRDFVSAKTSFDNVALAPCEDNDSSVYLFKEHKHNMDLTKKKSDQTRYDASKVLRSDDSHQYHSNSVKSVKRDVYVENSRKSNLKNFVKRILSTTKRRGCMDLTTQQSPVPSAAVFSQTSYDSGELSDNFDGKLDNVAPMCFQPFSFAPKLESADASQNNLQEPNLCQLKSPRFSSIRQNRSPKVFQEPNLRLRQSPRGYWSAGADLSDTSTSRSSNNPVRVDHLSPSYSMPTLVGGLKHRDKRGRSKSIEVATLPGSVNRHKAALLSLCCKLEPVEATLDAGEDVDVSRSEEDCAFDADASDSDFFDSSDYMEKLSRMQYSDSIYDRWTHTNSTGCVRNGIPF